MDLFDKAIEKAKKVGNNVASTAMNVGNTIGNVTKEQTELAGLKLQRSTIDKKLEGMYAQIGKKYVSYIEVCDSAETFDVEDIISDMQHELNQIRDLDAQIEALEEQIKKNSMERELKKAEEQFEAEKSRLDKALAMDILTAEEYESKLEAARRKLDNFDQIRKIHLQYEMDIITKEEHDEKIAQILK